MSREPENFDQVLRLLALKRHEQPPPGYFERLHCQVLARLELGDHRAQGFSLERWLSQIPGLSSIWNALETRPALAGVFGLAISGLLIMGAVSSEEATANSFATVPVATADTRYAVSSVSIDTAPGVPAMLQTVSHAGLAPGASLLGSEQEPSLFLRHQPQNPLNPVPVPRNFP